MKRQPPVRKNDELTLSIDALTSEGQGIGRVEGFAVFVPGALPGEQVRAHVIKVTASYAVAKLIEVPAPAPERVRPACGAFPACGGCTLQHLDYAAQLALKQQRMERLLGEVRKQERRTQDRIYTPRTNILDRDEETP